MSLFNTLKYIIILLLISSFIIVSNTFAYKFTVGGISSGCFMSTQFHYAFSSMIKGNACTAGGPFWCAQSSESIALTECMDSKYAQLINVDYLESIVYSTELTGFIDPVYNLVDSKVWLLSAQNDSVVAKTVVEKNAQLYGKFIANKSIKLITNVPGEHSQLTNTYGNECYYLGSPYINNCGYSSAYEGLNWLYYPVTSLNNTINKTKPNLNSLYQFDQTKYIPGPFFPEYGLNKIGYIYIPTSCYKINCPTHIVFHGCLQTLDLIGIDFIKYSGYLEVGETNNIIMLFPQASSTLLNPNGCWDWWGYTGPDYASNIGIQMLTVKNIISSNTYPYLN